MLDSNLQAELDRQGLRNGRLLLAVSGGRDSMVLLDLVLRCRSALELGLVVAHINHGLRDDASDGDESHVRQAARAAGLDFHTRRVSPESMREGTSSRERPTLEEAARDLRREALIEIAAETDCDWIATAHHAGDQTETVLLRLLRGTGPDGLAGMRPQSADGRWRKPMLRILPEEIEAWARSRGVAWREDASNQDRRFARNRLRLDWIPSISESFNPQLLRTVGDLAEATGRDREWIDGLVDEAMKGRVEIAALGIQFAIDGWQDVPEALARRLVLRGLTLSGLGRDVTRVHLERVLAFLRRGRGAGRDKELQLPGGNVMRRRDDCFELRGGNA
jgi:tRNA(Ile)-lysidine synthase